MAQEKEIQKKTVQFNNNKVFMLFSDESFNDLKSKFKELVGDSFVLLRPDYKQMKRQTFKMDRYVMLCQSDAVETLKKNNYRVEPFNMYEDGVLDESKYHKNLYVHIPRYANVGKFVAWLTKRLTHLKQFGVISEFTTEVPRKKLDNGKSRPVGFVLVNLNGLDKEHVSLARVLMNRQTFFMQDSRERRGNNKESKVVHFLVNVDHQRV